METERLLLRQWAESDVEALAPIFAEPAVWRFPFGRGFTREETEQFVERQVAARDVPLLVHEITRDAWELAG